MTTIEEILGGIRLPRLSARVYTRGDLLGEVTRLSNDYEATRLTGVDEDGPANVPGESKRQQIYGRLQELTAQIEESVVTFELQALSSTAYRKLQEAHPPVVEGLPFNPDTFPQALISACSLDPKMTVKEVEQLFDRIHEGEFKKLWDTAIAVNVAEVTAPKFVRRSVAEVLNGTSSTIAPVEESLEAFSSAE